MAAIRKTPTVANGGPRDGVNYMILTDAEIEALWKCVPERLVNVAGTANDIVATSDTSTVSAVLSISAPKSFWLTPIFNNGAGGTFITIDGVPRAQIVDADGNALLMNALVAGRQALLTSDGTALRLMSASGGSSIATSNLVNNGRLSPHTGIYVPGQAYTGETSLYWTIGDRGNQISLYDGISAWSTIASPEVSIKATNAQSGSTHNGTRIIDGLVDTSQLIAGMVISGTGVGGGAVISSVDSATQVTSSVNGTSSATNTITFKLPKNTAFDVYGKNVASAHKLFVVARSALFTPTANVLQDGIEVKASDTSLRWLGFFRSSNTDGQIDYTLTGQYRFSIWNQDNRVYREHVEAFSGSGTWYKSPATTRVKSDVAGGSGSAGTAGTNNSGIINTGGPGGAGGRSIKTIMAAVLGTTETVTVGGASGTSSFGSQHSATGGAAGTNGSTTAIGVGAPGADGVGSSGDTNFTGHGPAGGATTGFGIDVTSPSSVTTATAQGGRSGWVHIHEVLEI